MSQEEQKFEAQAYLRLLETEEGKVLVRALQKDFDAAMMQLLFAKDDLLTSQGRAQTYHFVLKKFTDAKAIVAAHNK